MSAVITLPSLLRIGADAIEALPEVLGQLGIRHPLIVTDRSMLEFGQYERLRGVLDAAGVRCGLFADTVQEPTSGSIDAGVAALTAADHDAMIALGGGSPIDSAKAMGVLARHGGRMSDYKVPRDVDESALPLVAIPTTAGTGSEVTRFTVITDDATDEKMLCRGRAFLPTAAIIDYGLTLTMPPRLIADTGIDALTHAIEAHVSRLASPFTDGLALSAMGRIARHLERAHADPADRPAREAMMLGATEAGMAFSNASVCLVHGMSRPVGALFHVPHGLSNAMLLPAVTRFSVPGAPARYASCARAMGWAPAEASDEQAVEALLAGLDRLNETLAVPGPARYGIDRGQWFEALPRMAEQAQASGSPANNPRVPTLEEMVEIYSGVWGNG